MEKFVRYAARIIRAIRQAYTRKWVFLGLFVFIFLESVIVLDRFDLLPSSPAIALAEEGMRVSANTSVLAAISELPIKIVIPAIGISATIANPTTTDTAILDQNLLKGAVRYPTSAKLGEAGNVVLFGHSSYLPIVGNQAYKTFNGIQKLSVGDAITIFSSDTAYTYQVRSIAKESANDAIIPLSVAGKVLTLATCNSFATKTDRFVVVADFVESHAISG